MDAAAKPANAELLETVLKAVPYPHQISDIDVHTDPEVLRFSWRGTRYRVDSGKHCEEVEGGCLVGSDKAILMRRLICVVGFQISCGTTVVPP
jgi:hypothetical protein